MCIFPILKRIYHSVRLEELVFACLPVNLAIGYVRLVLGHNDEIPIRYFVHRFAISQMKAIHERSNLTKKRLVSYGFGFAASLATLLAEVDSIEKSCTLSSLIAAPRAMHIS